MKNWHVSPLILASSDFQPDLLLHFFQSWKLPAVWFLTGSLLRQTISSPYPISLGKLPSALPSDKFYLNTRLFKKTTNKKKTIKTQQTNKTKHPNCSYFTWFGLFSPCTAMHCGGGRRVQPHSPCSEHGRANEGPRSWVKVCYCSPYPVTSSRQRKEVIIRFKTSSLRF